MFILKKGHQPGVYVPLRALFLVVYLLLAQVFPRPCSFLHILRLKGLSEKNEDTS